MEAKAQTQNKARQTKKKSYRGTILQRGSVWYWRHKLPNGRFTQTALHGAITRKEAEQQVKADLAQLYNTYENNLQIVSFEEESERVAFDNLDAALEKYKLGTLPGIEFREFQRSYIDAVDRKVSALYQAKISELSLLLISGKILE